MTDSPSLLPNDLDALRALLLAERAAHAAAVIARNAAVAERNTAMAQRDQLAARAAQLEHILKGPTSAASPSASPTTSWRWRSRIWRPRSPRPRRKTSGRTRA